jgi:predicted DNA-binding antitoxin AbrB/MazE fold protein
MTHIDAIYQDGVFKPLQKVDLMENERVRLKIEPSSYKEEMLAWLERIRKHHQEFLERHGCPLPDSTPDIAEDRMRGI